LPWRGEEGGGVEGREREEEEEGERTKGREGEEERRNANGKLFVSFLEN